MLFSNFLMVFYFKPIHCSSQCKVTSTCWEILTGPLVELFCHHMNKSIYSSFSEDSVHTWQVCQTGFFFPSINCKVLWFLYLGKCYEIKAYKVGKHVLLKYNVGRISYLGKQVHWFQLWNFVHRDVMGNWK